MKRITAAVLAVIAVSSAGLRAGVKITPVADVSVKGGQYFVEGESSSFGGNSEIYYSPVLNFSSGDALVPLLSISYRGTRDVQELIGGSALTRETAAAGLSLKYIKPLGAGKLKIRGGGYQSLVNETADEDWGQGLFDYLRITGGAEYEFGWEEWDLSAGADYHAVSFSNYDSLVSQSEEDFSTAIDTRTYSEISENAGTDVLDYADTAVTVSASRDYQSSDLSGEITYSLRNYSDQSVVNSDGSFSDSLRSDKITDIRLSGGYGAGRVRTRLSSYSRILRSNQNSYDANTAKYTDNFYSYFQTELVPSVTFLAGDDPGWTVSLWWSILYRRYSDRPAQKADAGYLEEDTYQRESGFGLSAEYPVMNNTFLSVSYSRRRSSSNMKYEANYIYNYTVNNYFAGVNFRY